MDVILLFPGQGSQKPGMGKELAATYSAAREVFERIDETLGVSLSTLCFEGPKEELTQTRNAQPALFAHGAAAWAVVKDALSDEVRAVAGHSLGELTAYHAADAITLENGAQLVRRRGEIMYDIGLERPGTMAVILGTVSTPIDVLCKQASDASGGLVVAANYNTDEQTVVSGEIEAVKRVMALAKEAGAKRAMELAVSGAFHSPLMAHAEAPFAEALVEAQFVDPRFPVYSNVTTEASSTAEAARDLLQRQLTAPVRWVELIRHMATQYPDATYVELGPGNVLCGLVSRIIPGARTMSCGTPAEVDTLIHQVA